MRVVDYGYFALNKFESLKYHHTWRQCSTFDYIRLFFPFDVVKPSSLTTFRLLGAFDSNEPSSLMTFRFLGAFDSFKSSVLSDSSPMWSYSNSTCTCVTSGHKVGEPTWKSDRRGWLVNRVMVIWMTIWPERWPLWWIVCFVKETTLNAFTRPLKRFWM